MINTCDILNFNPETCLDKQWVPGLHRRIYLTRRNRIANYSFSNDGNITEISFVNDDEALIRLYGEKQGHSGQQELQTRDGKFIKQSLSLRLRQRDGISKNAIQALIHQDDLVAIVETYNQTFRVYFTQYGAEMMSLRQSDGAKPGDDTAFAIVLEGAETRLIPDFINENYEVSAALLDSYVSV